MQKLEVGATIGIPCSVQPGPFSGERLISLETVNGLISGFVRDEELKEFRPGEWCVRAVVEDVYNHDMEVRIRGSFFTTNGIAVISRDVAYAA